MKNNHNYPIASDTQLIITIENLKNIIINIKKKSNHNEFCWFLEVDYTALSKYRFPSISTWNNGKLVYTQYLEPAESGKRLINLSGITFNETTRLEANNCKLHKEAKLLGFKKPELENDPILIIAPHADDAELAAYGFYKKYNKNVWIVTVTAGETQKRLDKQYIPYLDQTTANASLRKGIIRSWNSKTTPLLAGILPEKNIMLGYFNDTLTELLENPEITVTSKFNQDLCPSQFRLWNNQVLITDINPKNTGKNLISDIKQILELVKPKTLVVTHPEIDPHLDHIATAKACALAMQKSNHKPEQVLMYANHLKGIRGFPRGPAHAAAGVWPLNKSNSAFGNWQLYSENLNIETQKEKAVALDTMHDLRSTLKLDKRVKRLINRYLSGIPLNEWKDYGAHDYFQTHIKAHEVFTYVSACAFISGLVGPIE